MIHVTIAGYTVRVEEALPEHDDPSCGHAMLVERFGGDTAGDAPGGSAVHVEVHSGFAWPTWPFLCVAQRYSPSRNAGCHPGLLLVPETAILFLGAGERLLAYNLRTPARLWEDHTMAGFHDWQRHGNLVLMAAELELAAWDLQGVKRWSTFVEPPWGYHVERGMVHLDVMGTTASFPLLSGPTQPHA